MHAPILETRSAPWPDEAACASAAAALACRAALLDAFVELAGPLGAGKTTFVRHLLRALGVAGRIKSPSYAVVEAYELPPAGTPAWHFDFYRFAVAREWQDAGFREVFSGPGLKLVEWAENAAEALPPCDLRLQLTPRPDDARDVTWTAHSPRGIELIGALAHVA